MKIITRTVWQMTADGMEKIEEDSHEYNGPVSQCFGGRSSTASTTTQDIDTRTIGFQDTEGLAVGAGEDVNLSIQTIDPGAVQAGVDLGRGAFDFAGEFGGEAFAFGRDIAQQAGETAQRAVETSRQAIAVVGTGGQSEITAQFSRVLQFAVIAAGVILGIMAFRRA